MSEAKREIITRIRRVMNIPVRDMETEYLAIGRSYIQSGSLDAKSRLRLFQERLREYDCQVHRCDEADLAQKISHVLTSCGKARILIPRSIPEAWLPIALRFVRDIKTSYDDLDRSEGILTGCSVAVALTGTIIMRHSSHEASRALTLLPDYHLCVVHANQVVETLPQAIRAINVDGGMFNITTISGPSATSDIEMTRVKGVHGPRTLEVILVNEQEAT